MVLLCSCHSLSPVLGELMLDMCSTLTTENDTVKATFSIRELTFTPAVEKLAGLRAKMN